MLRANGSGRRGAAEGAGGAGYVGTGTGFPIDWP